MTRADTYDFTGQKVTLLKKYPIGNFLDCTRIFFEYSAPKIGGVLTKTFSKASFTRFLQETAPGAGAFYQISPDVATYLHTTLLQEYPKNNFLDFSGTSFQFSAPKIGGVLAKAFSKGSFTRFFPKNAPPGGGFYQISPDLALTTCIQL